MKTGNTGTIAIVAILTAMTLLCGGTAFAKRSSVDAIGNIEGINLTEGQKVKLEKNDNDHRTAMSAYKSELAAATFEKNTLVRNKDFKKAAVEEKIRKIMSIRTAMEMSKLEKRLGIRGILTSTQWRLLNEHLYRGGGMKLMQKHSGKKRDMKGGGQKGSGFFPQQ